MASVREAVLTALHRQLQANVPTNVLRNAVLPERLPPEGVVILRDGEPGEPDVTLNPRSEFYAHGTELEAYVPRDATGGGEAMLDQLLGSIGAALRVDPSLGGRAEHLTPSAPETGALAIDGAAPILTAQLVVTVEYLVSDPLSD